MKNSYATRALLCGLSVAVCQSWASIPVSPRLSRTRSLGSAAREDSRRRATPEKKSNPLGATSYEDDPEYFGEKVREAYNPKQGDEIQVEVTSFGPLGASILVVAKSHDPQDVLDVDQEPYARGIVFQNEIRYFRERRNNVDVVLGEVLKGYVSKVREDGKLDVSLRPLGGRARVLDWGPIIYQRIREQPDGVLQLGDKSSPEDIAMEFPGISKKSFKQAVSALYKQRMVQPGPFFVKLVEKED